MKYTTTFINKNFRMKVYGLNAEGIKVNTLMGVSGIIELIGVELFNKFLDRALANKTDSCCCKLRRGVKITFYNK